VSDNLVALIGQVIATGRAEYVQELCRLVIALDRTRQILSMFARGVSGRPEQAESFVERQQKIEDEHAEVFAGKCREFLAVAAVHGDTAKVWNDVLIGTMRYLEPLRALWWSYEDAEEGIHGVYPGATEYRDGRLERTWTAKVDAALPSKTDLEALASRVMAILHAEIRDACGDASELLPSVQLTRLEDRHLIIRIEYSTSKLDAGDLMYLSQKGTMVLLDRELHFTELQGVPRSYWTILETG